MPLPVAALLMLAALSLCACGYRMVGQNTLPGNVDTIGIKMLVNRSIETGAEAIVTNALSDELNRRRPGTLKRIAGADAILTGTIESINRKTVSRSGALTARQRQVTVRVSLALEDRTGKMLWGRVTLEAAESYAVKGDDKLTNEINRRNAIAEASQRLAEDAYRALTDDF